MTDFASIQALRNEGLSFSQIGARFGLTKDQARGIYARGVNRVGGLDVVPAAAGDGGATLSGRAIGDAGRPLDLRRDEELPDADARSAGPGPRYVGFSIGFFDLEASGLNGSFGRLFSAACAHVDGEVWEARIDDPQYRNRRHPSDDYKMAVAIRDHLLSHDILVSWNGKRGWNSKGRSGFDIPMLNARLMVPGHDTERVIGRYVKHIDLLKEIRKYIELHSFRLAAVEEFLQLAEQKNAILPMYWNRALDGDRDALDYICLHNRKDVLVLRLVFEAMRRAGLLEKPSW